MHYYACCFLLGIISLNLFSALPGIFWFAGLIILALFVWRYTKLIAIYLLGFAWIIFYAHWINQWELPHSLESKNLTVQGIIVTIPETDDHNQHFIFHTNKINHQKVKTNLRLSWHNEKIKLHVGEKWQLTVRLKRIHSNSNSGSFDYEAFAFQEGIRASGYVVVSLPNFKISHHWYHATLNQLREDLLLKIQAALPKSATSHWIIALCLGVRSQVPVTDWEILRATGTNHLMAIGGLHIGTMAALAHFIVFGLWRLSLRGLQFLPAQVIAALGSLVMTLIYSAMSGFSIPAQRASLMLICFLILLVRGRNRDAWQAWSLALLLVLLWNPLTTLTESFWLSFGAVAFIIYGMKNRLAPDGLWWKYGRVQWVIAIGLIPFSLFFFNQLSLITFIANMIAIPWVALGVVPFCVIGALLLYLPLPMGGWLLLFADKVLNCLWIVLTWLAHCPHVIWYQTVSVWLMVLGLFAVILFLLPKGFPGRYFAILFFLPLVLHKPNVPHKNEFWLHVLDVGQGLAVVVQTHQHTLVFDTGAKLGAKFDMGASVVVPFLHSIGTNKLDMVVISHGDNDHVGGLNAVLKSFSITSIKTSVPEKIPQAHLCLQGDKWEWDGVTFEFLYPSKGTLHLNNDSSCVLRIVSGDQKVLLTGDIEKFAEENLIKHKVELLSARILIAPHHGSKTSGLNKFLMAVDPNYVVFATGYRNRYHFPHAIIVKKYQDLGAVMLNTAETGAILFRLNQQGLNYELYRMKHKHFWN